MKLAKLLSGAIAAAALAPAAHAAFDVTANPGDVLVGFRANGGTGATVNVLANLGAATIYRDATTNIFNIGNVGSLLTTTYGATWFDRTDLTIGFISANNGIPSDNSGAVAVGEDPNSTVYASVRRTSLGAAGVRSSTIPGSTITLDGAVQPAGGSINALVTGPYDNNDVNGTASLASTASNGWNENVTGDGNIDFGLINIESAFASSNRGVFAGVTSEALLDFYRIPEYVGGNAPGTDGVGSFEGTFAIDNAGNISFVAVPEPSTYAFIALGVLGMYALVRRSKKVSA